MTQLTDAERLEKVKTALGLSGNYQNDTISLYIDDVIDELVSAGVSEEIAKSEKAVGCISVGVSDLWNYTSGGVKHSEYFNRRLVQLSLASIGSSGGGGAGGSYNDLTDKPTLNGTTLVGDLESPDVDINEVSNTDIVNLF